MIGRRPLRSLVQVAAGAVLMVAWGQPARAQVTPAEGYTPPDDTPSIRIGLTLYTDYTFTQSPTQNDSDGNEIHPSQFNVGRSYINVTGNISHIVAFRVTPDVVRQTGTVSSTNVTNDSLVFRIKYAYAQFNFDDWMTRGSYARFGIHQTPWVDFEEGIYRYRFQGTVFSEREGYLVSADGGASFHYNLPANYGDVHIGVYNGENYQRPDPNNKKAIEFRGTIRPFAAGMPVLRGLRGHLFYDGDNYVKDAERKRLIGSVTFEHTYLNAGYEYLNTGDQTSVFKPDVKGKGYSIWATPRSPMGFEGLLRYDRLTPSKELDSQLHTRTILGIAYWFPHQGNVSTAILLDYDKANFPGTTAAPQKKVAVHGLVNF